jgi:aminocarboxymuconate-semialdehyde decarboxylase
MAAQESSGSRLRGDADDLDFRFRLMDRFEGVVQVLTNQAPFITKEAVDLAKATNDGMAELLVKYPDRFVAAIACIPMNNIDAALKEVDRAIKDLRFRGVMVSSYVEGKPLDSPEFMLLYEKMSQYDLPVYTHPHRTGVYPDYFNAEDRAKYRYGDLNIDAVFGWPYETTVAMTRLVFSGILERYPNLKIVTHHCGGMVPYYAQRIIQHHYLPGNRGTEHKYNLPKDPIDYYKMFYNDTAIHGNTPALMCAYDFFGADHLLFGADFPAGDRNKGYRSYMQTINAIEQMDISDIDKKKIFADNARRLLRLPI